MRLVLQFVDGSAPETIELGRRELTSVGHVKKELPHRSRKFAFSRSMSDFGRSCWCFELMTSTDPQANSPSDHLMAAWRGQQT
jgi:hypothetical protein